MSTRTLVIHPYVKGERTARTPQASLEEARGLADAIVLNVIDAMLAPLRSVRPATHLGKGKVEELALLVKSKKIGLVIMDCSLTPIQQRNLEKELNCKVIDRTALILEIFGARAQTKEGTLQVELASLEYQKSRLVRSWTHLERQRGGFGFLGGPGETQIEIDRRIIGERIGKIKKQLEKVKNTRTLHRKSRQKVPYPVVALVGYTNAGKSTLFNRLTGADVYVEDLLFATLDPTMRIVKLPSGRKIILSDTVGFISQLPTELVAAFRATLEEVIEANIICHVRDISSEHTDEEKDDVLKVLERLGLEEKIKTDLIEVANKIDLLSDDILTRIPRETVAISALTGKGCDKLLSIIDTELNRFGETVELVLDSTAGKQIAWLHAHGENVSTRNKDDKVIVTVTLSPENLARFKRLK